MTRSKSETVMGRSGGSVSCDRAILQEPGGDLPGGERNDSPRGVESEQARASARRRTGLNSQAAIRPAPRGRLSDEEWFAQMIEFGVAPMVARAQIKHRHDLPELMRQHPYHWVAYRGDEPLEIGPLRGRALSQVSRSGPEPR
jgi:hypothetical protein